jgi:hypothetical protein
MRSRRDLRAALAAAVPGPELSARDLLKPAVGRKFAPMRSRRDLRAAPASKQQKPSVKMLPRCPTM